MPRQSYKLMSYLVEGFQYMRTRILMHPIRDTKFYRSAVYYRNIMK